MKYKPILVNVIGKVSSKKLKTRESAVSPRGNSISSTEGFDARSGGERRLLMLKAWG